MNKSARLSLIPAAVFLGMSIFPDSALAADTQEKIVASLCTAEETAVFACMTRQQKNASLCASKNLSAKEGYLVYRFGRIDKKPELVFPETGTKPDKVFTYSTYTYPKGHGEQVAFNVGDYGYTVYDDTHAYGASGSGVIVQKSGKRVASLMCQGRVEIRFDRLESAGLPEAKDPVWPKRDGPDSNTPP